MTINMFSYETLRFRAEISKHPNFVWCLACNSGRLHEGGDDQPIVECMECHAQSCFKHKMPWHHGITCEIYDKLQKRYIDGFGAAQPKPPFKSFWHYMQEIFHRRKSPEKTTLARAAKIHDEAEAKRYRQRSERGICSAIARIKQQRHNAASEKTIKKVCKNCPNPDCNAPIEKRNGCSHMICKIIFHTPWS